MSRTFQQKVISSGNNYNTIALLVKHETNVLSESTLSVSYYIFVFLWSILIKNMLKTYDMQLIDKRLPNYSMRAT